MRQLKEVERVCELLQSASRPSSVCSDLLIDSQVTSEERAAFKRRDAARRKVGSISLATVVKDNPVARAERSRVTFKSSFILEWSGAGFLLRFALYSTAS